jgi:oxalate decarboxylase
MHATRRALLGAAALGASGLALMQNAAGAGASEHGNPGEGGYARNAVQLPPGAEVAYHDPKDIEAMPNFKYSLDGNIPKITSGGWAKESTIHQLPVSKGIAGVHMFLNPGASRELHCHAIAANGPSSLMADAKPWLSSLQAQARSTTTSRGIFGTSPKATAIRSNASATSLATLSCLSTMVRFSEHGTFSITDWIDVTPKDILAANFNLPKDAFDAFPKGETYIQAGPVVPVRRSRRTNSDFYETPGPRAILQAAHSALLRSTNFRLLRR